MKDGVKRTQPSHLNFYLEGEHHYPHTDRINMLQSCVGKAVNLSRNLCMREGGFHREKMDEKGDFK